MSVGLVIVSHSAKIAEGVVDLARQMAADVSLQPAGGTADGGIGTSFELVQAGIESADSGDGVVVLCDLGSAVLTAETALDFLEGDERARVRISDAPLVEGAVAAAVAAQSGEALDAVLAAAATAGGTAPAVDRSDAAAEPESAADPLPITGRDAPEPAQGESTDAARASVELINREGLHARPAAEFVRLAATFDASVTVNGVDAKSLLRIMALGLTAGDGVELIGSGPQAADAVEALRALIASGFGEA